MRSSVHHVPPAATTNSCSGSDAAVERQRAMVALDRVLARPGQQPLGAPVIFPAACKAPGLARRASRRSRRSAAVARSPIRRDHRRRRSIRRVPCGRRAIASRARRDRSRPSRRGRWRSTLRRRVELDVSPAANPQRFDPRAERHSPRLRRSRRREFRGYSLRYNLVGRIDPTRKGEIHRGVGRPTAISPGGRAGTFWPRRPRPFLGGLAVFGQGCEVFDGANRQPDAAGPGLAFST